MVDYGRFPFIQHNYNHISHIYMYIHITLYHHSHLVILVIYIYNWLVVSTPLKNDGVRQLG